MRQDIDMPDEPATELDRLVNENKLLMKKLQRSIRSSIALSRRRSSWDSNDVLSHAEAFGEALESKYEDFGYDLGTNRLKAIDEVRPPLRGRVEPYVTYFHAYLSIAEHINTASGERWRTSNRARVKLNVLCELHAQALTIAEEIVVLLRNGLPTGASARWRTLYEITTVARFISRSPNVVAERYQGSHIVEQQLRILRGDSDFLLRTKRFSALERDRRRAIAEEYERLVALYGPAYGYSFGWAAERLRKKRVTFADIERRVGDTSRRHSYVTASQHIHGVRLSSIRTMTHRPSTESVFEQGGQDPYVVQVDTIWTLQDLTWELAETINRTQSVPEALYWGFTCHLLALDADTEAQRGRFKVYPSYLRSLLSIEPPS